MTFFSASRVSVRCPVGLGSRPRTAASCTSDSDWIVPDEPTHVLKPFLRTAWTARLATRRIAFFISRMSRSEGGSFLAWRSARRTTPSGRLSVRSTRVPSEMTNSVEPPADVDEEEGVLVRRELAAHGEVDEARLLLAGDHLHPHARALLDGGDELVRLGRLADGAGRHGAHHLGAGAVGELGEVLHRRRRPASMASGESRPVRSVSLPSRTIAFSRRTTSSVPSSSTLATSSLMLLVPMSMAARVFIEAPVSRPGGGTA